MAKAKPKRLLKRKKSAKAKPRAAKTQGKARSGRWVYLFGDGKDDGKAGMRDMLCGDGTADGKAGMRDLLGGKGANLAEMANLGLPVPPGFTITTDVCTYFYA